MKSKFTYVGIRVTNLQRSIDFYTKVLGMKVTGGGKIGQTKGETVDLQSEKDGFVLELNYYDPDSAYNINILWEKGWIIWPSRLITWTKRWKKPD